MRRVPVLQPEDTRGRVRRHVLDVRRVDRLLCSGGHEDLNSIVVVADGTLVERALDALRDEVLAPPGRSIAYS